MSDRPKPQAAPSPHPLDQALRVEVPTELVDKLLDAAVRALLGTSWGEARRLIETGKVQLAGEVVLDPLRKVRKGNWIEYAPRARRPRPETDLEAERIVFADAQVIVVDKPSGISTVPYVAAPKPHEIGRRVVSRETGTLDARVRAWLQTQLRKEPGQVPPNLGVVHRIDNETSGLLVFTRTWAAKQSLASQFRAHTVERRYFALVHGRARAARYETHLMDDRGDGLRGSWEARPRKGKPVGQRAITHVQPIEELPGGATLVECKLETGRTHQIRIHLSEAGHPLVGERVYVRNYRNPQIPAPRLMLHAQTLGFIHPTSEELVQFEREPPADFRETLARLRQG